MLQSRLKSPCLHCTNRHIGCHSQCELYKMYRKEYDDLNANIRREKAYRSDRTAKIHSGYTIDKRGRKAAMKTIQSANK